MLTESDSWISFEGETYHLAAGERALDALLRRGAPVTFSCRKGSCQSCMMQVVSGEPGEDAQARLPQKMRELGFFLPCCTTAPRKLVAARPDWSLCTYEAVVAEKTELAPSTFRLRLEPVTEIAWRPGQTVSLIAADGARRTYSIASIRDEDYFLDLHIRHFPGGAVSDWIANGVCEGDTVTLQGPTGSFTYDSALADTPLVLIGTGTGQGAVLAVTRDALRQGHRAGLHLVLGARSADGLYLAEEARALAARHSGLRITLAASREAAFGQPPARTTSLAFSGDMTHHAVYLCGAPGMVETARVAAVAHGVAQRQIFADPFDPPGLYQTTEREKLAALQPNPALWTALGEGAGLTLILEDFYTQVYADPRLSPYFHRVTKQRAVEKQFSFLRDIFLGVSEYFGERPFNAHHWMVISDELFTYREEMFFATVRRHGLAEPLIRDWAAMHELFRREIVKSAPRGQLFFGVERSLEGYVTETLGVDTVCDSCHGEILFGQTAQMHKRTGELFCAACASK